MFVYEHGGWHFEIRHLHFETDIRLIITIVPHRIFPTHALDGLCVIDIFYFLENIFDQPLEHVEDIFLLYKSHLTIDLRELWLPVCTKVFITKTFYDLVITVIAADHQQLLERL